ASKAIRIATRDWTDVAIGFDHACGIVAHDVQCFGSNDQGQSGQPMSSETVPVPTSVPGLPSAFPPAVAAGFNRSCAILGASSDATSGQLWCWGSAGDGIIPGTDLVVPATQVSGDATWTAITFGARAACGVRADQAICWGSESEGGLGDGIWQRYGVPVEMES